MNASSVAMQTFYADLDRYESFLVNGGQSQTGRYDDIHDVLARVHNARLAKIGQFRIPLLWQRLSRSCRQCETMIELKASSRDFTTRRRRFSADQLITMQDQGTASTSGIWRRLPLFLTHANIFLVKGRGKRTRVTERAWA